MPGYKCGNENTHDFHHFEQPAQVHCSGKTDCGKQLHEAHTLIRQMRVWCPGVCDCKIFSYGEHGPGEHK